MDFVKDLMIIACIVTSIACAIVVVDEKVCSSYGKETQRDVKYKFLTCYVNAKDTWLTREEYKMAIMGTQNK